MEIINNLKICFWNAHSIRNKINETIDFINNNNIDVLILTETWLQVSDKIHASNFKCYRLDRTNRGGGGIAVLINRKIQHSLLPYYETKVIECLGFNIISESGNFNLIAVYFPGSLLTKQKLCDFKSDLNTICNTYA